MPSDQQVEKSLRSVIRARFQKEDLTINSVRLLTRKELDLEDDFFDNATWKTKSKTIIKDQIEKCEAEEGAQQLSEPEEVTKPAQKKKSLKRSSPAQSPRPRKKSKVAEEEDDEESTALSEPPVSDEESVEDVKPAKKPKTSKPKPKPKPKAQKKVTPKPEEDDSSNLSDASDNVTKQKSSTGKDEEADETSSELSSVIDDPDPPRKKGKAKNGDTKAAPKAKKPAAEADPNAEEIKKLQGWLVKCGIRKVWGKELKPYETQKAKIAHLKSMLAEVGMTGRFSNEKAAQIKEARELAADIEAVQEGNERWGKASGDESEEQGRPKRRVMRGAQNYDFLSSDGEETD